MKITKNYEPTFGLRDLIRNSQMSLNRRPNPAFDLMRFLLTRATCSSVAAKSADLLTFPKAYRGLNAEAAC